MEINCDVQVPFYLNTKLRTEFVSIYIEFILKIIVYDQECTYLKFNLIYFPKFKKDRVRLQNTNAVVLC